MAFFIVERHSHKFLNLYVFSRLEVVNFMFEILKEYNRYRVLANHRSFNVFLSAKSCLFIGSFLIVQYFST